MHPNQHSNQSLIPPPSWEGVRSIYKKLSDEFSVLTSAFDLSIDEEKRKQLDHLIIAIDEIDTCIDELPSKAQRDSITASIVAFLSDGREHWTHPAETPGLPHKIENLNQVVRQLNVKAEFIAAAETIFSNTELKRHSLSVDELINHITVEGRATSVLTLSVMEVGAETPFGTFFTKLCMLMGIADLIFDARQDFKKGYIALKPSGSLYAKLIKITISDGLGLLFHIPRKIRFTNYCLRMAFALMKGW